MEGVHWRYLSSTGIITTVTDLRLKNSIQYSKWWTYHQSVFLSHFLRSTDCLFVRSFYLIALDSVTIAQPKPSSHSDYIISTPHLCAVISYHIRSDYIAAYHIKPPFVCWHQMFWPKWDK